MIERRDKFDSEALNRAMDDRGEFMKRLTEHNERAAQRLASLEDECSCGHRACMHDDDGCQELVDGEECPCADYVP